MDKRFIVTDHNYLNTGGNCMVSIFAVYDTQENISRYVIANEEGFNYQTADTISSELQLDSDELINKIVLQSHKWDALTCDPCWDQHLFDEDEFELFKYCEFEFYKKDCKYFNNRVRIAVNNLPNDLFNKLTKEYIAWAELEGVGCLTDGFDVYMDEGYEPPVVETKPELQVVKDFKQYLYDNVLHGEHKNDAVSYITIAVAGDSVKIPLHADSYEWLDKFLSEAIEKW